MGTWNYNFGQGADSETFNYKVKDVMANRVRAGAEGELLTSSGGYSVVGMKVEAIDQMRDALRNYVKRIQDHLDQIDSTTSASNAFRSFEGNLENAVQNYINNVKEYCKVLTSYLLAFSDQLAIVKQAWVEQTSEIADVISKDVSSQSTSTSYTDDYPS